jgi:hypothetical protein
MPTIARNRVAKAARGAPGDVRGRDSKPRQQKSIKARETHIVNGLTPDFSHGLLEIRTARKCDKKTGFERQPSRVAYRLAGSILLSAADYRNKVAIT